MNIWKIIVSIAATFNRNLWVIHQINNIYLLLQLKKVIANTCQAVQICLGNRAVVVAATVWSINWTYIHIEREKMKKGERMIEIAFWRSVDQIEI